MEPRISSSQIGVVPSRTGLPTRKKQQQGEDIREFYSPPKPAEYVEPDEAFIEERLARALAAMKKGVFWDRGSIVNIVI